MNTRPTPALLPSLTLLASLMLTAMPASANSGHEAPAAPAPRAAAPAAAAHGAPAAAPAAPVAAEAARPTSSLAQQVRAAVTAHQAGQVKQVSLVINPADAARTAPHAARVAAAQSGHGAASGSSREYIRAKAAALAGHGAAAGGGGHEAHWDYAGENGPERWGQMKPDFNVCAIGNRQSPIHIQTTDAVPGPAEPIEFRYGPSGGSVVNNGHTIQVDVTGHNYIKVRGTPYKLVQFHFHHPAEEKVNYKGFAMVAHLVHKNEAGQLAVVAVLLDVGANNPFIQKVWTRMPLDTNDRVQLPDDLLNLNELLPTDQRYYQFMGSLTTPPCTEGVLWQVLKQPVTLGPDQLKLFTKLFPMNARPVQAVNGRLVREGT
ncbi:carbonic anhydrase [Hydrogenophaga sp. RWCD_12]|uniref:carbonic anhydrase n=1 Tax=Hydrogenophaga sp. RWCD_12 TaxID=3391190 RepID=UPI003984FE33